jgi:hypothetical protein
MSETLAQHGKPMSQAFFGPSELIGHLGHIATARIFELRALEQILDTLLWVELRRIAGQALQMGPFGSPRSKKALISLVR